MGLRARLGVGPPPQWGLGTEVPAGAAMGGQETRAGEPVGTAGRKRRLKASTFKHEKIKAIDEPEPSHLLDRPLPHRPVEPQRSRLAS